MELVRTRLAVSSEGTYRGMADCIRRVLKYEGMRAFYRGLLPSLVSPSLRLHSVLISATAFLAQLTVITSSPHSSALWAPQQALDMHLGLSEYNKLSCHCSHDSNQLLSSAIVS